MPKIRLKIILSAIALSVAPFAAHASNFFPLPANFIASTTQVMAGVFDDMGPYLLLVIGVMIAMSGLEVIVGATRPRH